MRVIGRGRYAGETYPQGSNGGGGGAPPAFAFDQNSNAYNQVTGGGPVQIATATITVAAGSRIKIEGLASVEGSVDVGRAYISTPTIAGLFGSQSFGTTIGTNFRTLNLVGVTAPQAAGPVTVNLFITVDGNAGARVDRSEATVLTLTEIPA